jgi:Ca2+-transporting ATPase
LSATSWHALPVGEVARTLAVDVRAGLPTDEVERRFARYGPNALEERGRKGPWPILRAQFTAVLVLLLLAAAAISLLIGDLKNAVAILAIVVVNAMFGFVQEYRAERAMESLKKMAAAAVRVRRGGAVASVPSREVVPGDVVLLEAGNIVPVDARVVVAASLRVQESALTGESEAVEKDVEQIAPADAPLGDRRGMVYTGTVVTYGRGEAVAVDTGMQTELGRIARLIQAATGEATPLQRRLAGLARQLAVVALVIVGAIASFGLWRGEPARAVAFSRRSAWRWRPCPRG